MDYTRNPRPQKRRQCNRTSMALLTIDRILNANGGGKYTLVSLKDDIPLTLENLLQNSDDNKDTLSFAKSLTATSAVVEAMVAMHRDLIKYYEMDGFDQFEK